MVASFLHCNDKSPNVRNEGTRGGKMPINGKKHHPIFLLPDFSAAHSLRRSLISGPGR
jgi:hypothetical protein